MNPEDFLAEVLAPVRQFCRTLDSKPPAYSYIPLRSDEERIRVMQSRLFNEMRAADLFGTWLKTTPELDVKATMAESAHEEMVHAQLDRKSTRLNSSHGYISYAVFCLKKIKYAHGA